MAGSEELENLAESCVDCGRGRKERTYGEKRKKEEEKANIPGRGQILLSVAGMAVLLIVSVLSFSGMYRSVTNSLARSAIDRMQKTADHDSAAAQAAILDREMAVKNWAYSVRNSGYTERGDILDAASQGSQLIGAIQLFLVDDDFFYYGSNGLVVQLAEYDADLQAMPSEVQTLRSDEDPGRMLTFVRIQPFTVDGTTFFYALAEFDAAAYEDALALALCGGETYAGILDYSGGELVRTNADTSFFRLMETAQIDGFASLSDLKQEIMDRDRLVATCHVNGESNVLISTKMPDRDWILLTLDPAPEVPSLFSPIMLLPLVLTILLVAAVQAVFVLRLRARTQRRRATAAEDRCAALQKALDSAQETNRSQAAFLDVISHNIRTPLNGIVGFTALAKRHYQEPAMVQGYLEKVAEASAQLLSRLNEGLDATGWHRYLEEEAPAAPEPEKTIDLTGKRILLVEDNALNRDIGEAILTEIGMLVECAENGQLGFQKIATSKPGYYDLVLMDIQMPVMDGYEATKTIRRLRSKMLAEIPILAMTANVSLEDKQKAFLAGMDGYVEKPMNIDQLLKAIQKALSQSFAD